MIIQYPLQLFDELGLDYKPDTEIITGVNINEESLAVNIHYSPDINLKPGANDDLEIIDKYILLTFSIFWDCDKDSITLDYINAVFDEKDVDAHIKTAVFEYELERLMFEEPITERDG